MTTLSLSLCSRGGLLTVVTVALHQQGEQIREGESSSRLSRGGLPLGILHRPLDPNPGPPYTHDP
jgi:hypothetical protein